VTGTILPHVGSYGILGVQLHDHPSHTEDQTDGPVVVGGGVSGRCGLPCLSHPHPVRWLAPLVTALGVEEAARFQAFSGIEAWR